MFLSLESKAHEAVLELDIDSINDKDSVGMLKQLDVSQDKYNFHTKPIICFVNSEDVVKCLLQTLLQNSNVSIIKPRHIKRSFLKVYWLINF